MVTPCPSVTSLSVVRAGVFIIGGVLPVRPLTLLKIRFHYTVVLQKLLVDRVENCSLEVCWRRGPGLCVCAVEAFPETLGKGECVSGRHAVCPAPGPVGCPPCGPPGMPAGPAPPGAASMSGSHLSHAASRPQSCMWGRRYGAAQLAQVLEEICAVKTVGSLPRLCLLPQASLRCVAPVLFWRLHRALEQLPGGLP